MRRGSPPRHGRPRGARPQRRRRGDREAQEPTDLQVGTIRLQADGGGRFVPHDASGPRLFVPPEDLSGLDDGDAVTIRVETGRKGRLRGRVVARGPARADEVVGIVHASGREWMLLPEPEGPPLLIPEGDRGTAREGDAVACRVVDFGRGARIGRAAVTEVLGRPGEPPVQVEMLIRGLGIPLRFDDTALEQAGAAPAPAADLELAAEPLRHDLRRVPHVTIDGEDARDFDDAVSARPEPGGIRVWVSIADVAHYVRPGTALDLAARERGTSVYFPHRAVPMLPERLSCDLCSLRQGVPRLTLTCELRVRPDGRVEDVRLYPSLIESAGRLTYTEVQAAMDGRGGPAASHAMLPDLVAAARALRARRRQRGAVDLDLPEAQVLLGPDGVAVHVRERGRLEAHKVIEDLMIAANEAVAETLEARGWPALYRVHEPPDPVRLRALGDWADTLGVHFDPEAAAKPKGLARLAHALEGRPQAPVGMVLLLRSMAQARYDTECLGHYGLASRAYLHFTSPIRRYPDLLVHRSLWALWHGEVPPGGYEPLAERTSLQERRADDAERKVEQLMACHVAERHLGEVFDAVVTGVHRAGAFVRVRDPWLEGLTPMSSLGEGTQDYYDVVAHEYALVGRRSGHRIALGDAVTVRLASVSTYRRQVDFELVRTSGRGETEGPSARRRPTQRPARPSERQRGRTPARAAAKKTGKHDRARPSGGKKTRTRTPRKRR